MGFEYYWEDICRIHLITKHYLLLAEEMSEGGDMFLQPLKEHRDAYDHIIRVYAAKNGINKPEKREQYMKSNMSKAMGHEYRAFFDTADWLSLICREKINRMIKGKSVEEIEKKYPDYKKLRDFLLDLPGQIAEQRERKDVGSNLLEEVDRYVEILDQLIRYSKDFRKALEG